MVVLYKEKGDGFGKIEKNRYSAEKFLDRGKASMLAYLYRKTVMHCWHFLPAAVIESVIG